MRDNTIIRPSRYNSSARINRKICTNRGVEFAPRPFLRGKREGEERPRRFFRSSRNTKRTVSSRNPGDGGFLRSPPVARATAFDPLFRSSAPICCHISCRSRCTTRQFSDAPVKTGRLSTIPPRVSCSRTRRSVRMCPRCARRNVPTRLLTLSARKAPRDDDKSGVSSSRDAPRE